VIRVAHSSLPLFSKKKTIRADKVWPLGADRRGWTKTPVASPHSRFLARPKKNRRSSTKSGSNAPNAVTPSRAIARSLAALGTYHKFDRVHRARPPHTARPSLQSKRAGVCVALRCVALRCFALRCDGRVFSFISCYCCCLY